MYLRSTYILNLYNHIMKTLNRTPEFIKQIHDSSTKEIAKQIRKDLKEVFGKEFKFGVRSDYNKIWVEAKSGNKEIYTEEYKKATTWEDFQELRENDRRLQFQPEIKNFKGMKFSYTDFGIEFTKTLESIVEAYNHDNCDLMTDYFDVNYYTSISTDSYIAS